MTDARTVFVFSGQGSQYARMGLPLYERDARFRRHLDRLDALARGCGAPGVLDAVLGRPSAVPFARTLATHPAIFAIEWALALRLADDGLVPDVAFGASLGTFAAATVAGCMDEAAAMRAVVAQAQAFEAHCAEGGMIAVLEAPRFYDDHAFLHRESELAAANFSRHFAIAAPPAAVAAIADELDRRRVLHQRLDVRFAFHSRWIDAARTPYLDAIAALPLRAPTLPLARCDAIDADPMAAPGHEDLWRFARRPMRFADAVARIERDGPCRYIDLGPSGTMATFLKYALPRGSASTAHAIVTPCGQDERNLAAVLAMRAGA